jgi:hypothetical protein
VKMLRLLAATGLVLAALALNAHAADPAPSIIHAGTIHVGEGRICGTQRIGQNGTDWQGAPLIFASNQDPTSPDPALPQPPAVSVASVPFHTWHEEGLPVVRVCLTGPVQTGHGTNVNWVILATPLS